MNYLFLLTKGMQNTQGDPNINIYKMCPDLPNVQNYADAPLQVI